MRIFNFSGINAQINNADGSDDDDASTTSQEEEGENGGRIGVTFDQLLHFQPSPLAETLSGQALVNYVNRRQNLWRVSLFGVEDNWLEMK